MKAYRLKKAGTIVPAKHSEPIIKGQAVPVTRAKVGFEGEEFKSLPDSLVEKIEAGEMEDTWEVVELGEPEYTSTGEDEEEQPTSTEATDYEAMSPRGLMALATERGIDVQGSGEGGRVLKGDVVAALRSADQEA